MKGIRLNRYLALCGIASRRKCEELITDQRIAVNGQIANSFAILVRESDEVTLDGGKIKPQQFSYIIMNKPRSVVTTLHDERNRKHVGMLLPRNVSVKPVGRLDKNTTGVLLFTNDGDLQYRLTHPKYQISRVYNATLDKLFSNKYSATIQQGIRLSYREIAYATVISVRHFKQYSIVTLELREGLNREIHRLFRVLGYRVTDLDRIKYAGLTVGALKRGEWRYLKPLEISDLKQACGLK